MDLVNMFKRSRLGQGKVEKWVVKGTEFVRMCHRGQGQAKRKVRYGLGGDN